MCKQQLQLFMLINNLWKIEKINLHLDQPWQSCVSICWTLANVHVNHFGNDQMTNACLSISTVTNPLHSIITLDKHLFMTVHCDLFSYISLNENVPWENVLRFSYVKNLQLLFVKLTSCLRVLVSSLPRFLILRINPFTLILQECRLDNIQHTVSKSANDNYAKLHAG